MLKVRTFTVVAMGIRAMCIRTSIPGQLCVRILLQENSSNHQLARTQISCQAVSRYIRVSHPCACTRQCSSGWQAVPPIGFGGQISSRIVSRMVRWSLCCPCSSMWLLTFFSAAHGLHTRSGYREIQLAKTLHSVIYNESLRNLDQSRDLHQWSDSINGQRALITSN